MKLKAQLTERGLNLLERRFIPALEKVGKICHLLLTHDHIFFLHNLLSFDSVQSIANFSTPSLFSDFHISSRNRDRISFSLDLSLLHRALRSSSLLRLGSNPSRIQLKLVKKLTRGSTKEAPFLTLETKGYRSGVVHDVPISRPLSMEELNELEAALDGAREVPRTMVHVPDVAKLVGFTERMKQIGDELRVCVRRNGGMDFRIETTLITIGAEMSGLVVVGEEDEGRGEEGEEVRVSLKSFCKSLGCQMTRPDCAFYGVGAEGGCLVVVFQFFVPGTRETDKSVSLHCRVPVIDPGQN